MLIEQSLTVLTERRAQKTVIKLSVERISNFQGKPNFHNYAKSTFELNFADMKFIIQKVQMNIKQKDNTDSYRLYTNA